MPSCSCCQVSKQVDKVARFVIPALYFCGLTLIFNLDLSDEYKEGSTMFEGMGPAYISNGGIVSEVVQ